MRVIALDHGEARCGVAVSDPTGELVTPLSVVDPRIMHSPSKLGSLIESLGGFGFSESNKSGPPDESSVVIRISAVTGVDLQDELDRVRQPK